MTIRSPWMGSVLVGVGLALTLTVSAQTRDTKAPPAGAAATIGDEVISMSDLEARVAVELANLETQRYRILAEKLTQAIRKRLLASEAQGRRPSAPAPGRSADRGFRGLTRRWPEFFINGEGLVGNQPLEDFQRIIERELARTAATT